jgi:LemA protein
MNIFGILLLLIIATIVYFIIIYNKFVSLIASIDSSWSDIDVQLKRRYNLIPALVDTVKGYKDYEASTLEKIVEARTMGMNASNVGDQSIAEGMLSQALGKIFALAEAYPQLKADTTFANLQNQLAIIEDDIQSARRYYNAVVEEYNAKLLQFPDLIIANKFNFQNREYFRLDESEEESVKKMPKIDL